MDPNVIQIGSTLIYKLACLGAGISFLWLGYKLFVKGINASTGVVKVEGGQEGGPKGSLSLENAAPGSFFSVLGALVVAATIWSGFDIHSMITTPDTATTAKAALTVIDPANSTGASTDKISAFTGIEPWCLTGTKIITNTHGVELGGSASDWSKLAAAIQQPALGLGCPKEQKTVTAGLFTGGNWPSFSTPKLTYLDTHGMKPYGDWLNNYDQPVMGQNHELSGVLSGDWYRGTVNGG